MQNLAADATMLEFKGRMLMVTVLRLTGLDLDTIEAQLQQRLADADWIRDVPLVIDVACDDADITASLPGIIDLLRDHQLRLVALAGNVTDVLETFLGLPRINLNGHKGHQIERTQETRTQPAAASPAANLLIDSPVRSGQQIYSQGDIIVTASVSTGAELLAEGNIHVYGNLRGRALAGVRGNTEARIFCQRLNAELVSIAGHYRVAEGLPDDTTNQAVQITLAGETMQFDAITRK